MLNKKREKTYKTYRNNYLKFSKNKTQLLQQENAKTEYGKKKYKNKNKLINKGKRKKK